MRESYGIDMSSTQRSKLIPEIPRVDIVIKMGCDVVCPYVPSRHEEDWGLLDPTGKGDEQFRAVIGEIDRRVRDLAQRIANGTLTAEGSNLS